MVATRPPLRTFLAYRLLEWSLPAAYHRWMFDDVTSRWYLCRRFAWSMLPTFAVFGALSFIAGLPAPTTPFIVGWVGMVLAMLVLSRFVDLGAGHRRRVLSRHGDAPTHANPADLR